MVWLSEIGRVNKTEFPTFGCYVGATVQEESHLEVKRKHPLNTAQETPHRSYKVAEGTELHTHPHPQQPPQFLALSHRVPRVSHLLAGGARLTLPSCWGGTDSLRSLLPALQWDLMVLPLSPLLPAPHICWWTTVG